MPMQPRPISETSSPALPRFRDLMVPPISRWPASGGRFVRVGHREQVAHGTQPDLPLAQVVASVVVVALDLAADQRGTTAGAEPPARRAPAGGRSGGSAPAVVPR